LLREIKRYICVNIWCCYGRKQISCW